MSCSQCACFKAANGDTGVCELNPPTLFNNKSPMSAESYFQPMTYSDWNCSKNIPIEVESKVGKDKPIIAQPTPERRSLTTPRGKKRGTKDKP